MALTEIYVDPSIAGDSGNGDKATPYGDLEYAIEQETFDTTNGTRVNIKAGTAEILAAEIDAALADTGTSIAWAPAETAPLVFQGYTTDAADGGQGEISGGGAVSIITTTRDFISLVDLKMGNTGANQIVELDDSSSIIRCESHTCTGSGFQVGLNGLIESCYIHHASAVNRNGISIGSGSICRFNYLALTSTNCSYAIYIGQIGGRAENNIIVMTGVGDATKYGILSIEGRVRNNSIYSPDAHVGAGVWNSINSNMHELTNNLIEGFSGTGGRAMAHDGTNTSQRLIGGNAEFNCASGFGSPANYTLEDLGDNETLTASPFTDAANGDFSPVDTGNVKEGSLPQDFGDGAI